MTSCLIVVEHLGTGHFTSSRELPTKVLYLPLPLPGILTLLCLSVTSHNDQRTNHNLSHETQKLKVETQIWNWKCNSWLIIHNKLQHSSTHSTSRVSTEQYMQAAVSWSVCKGKSWLLYSQIVECLAAYFFFLHSNNVLLQCKVLIFFHNPKYDELFPMTNACAFLNNI